MNQERNSMKHQTLVSALLAVIVVSACVPLSPVSNTPPGNPSASEASLDDWIDDKLSPYLVEKLSKHPRFRQRTIVLATLSGDNMSPQTNALVQYIQSQVKDALLAVPTIKLAWQPANKRDFNLQHLAELDCAQTNTKPIIIGIESRVSQVNQKTQIRVRALDPEEDIWIPGLSLKWEGVLPANYQALMHQQQPEPHLQGLRHRPFKAHQADMVANYLAKNMSCLLRGRTFGGDLTLNTAMPTTNHPFLTEVAAHIDNYLTRFQAVTVTQDAPKANFTLQYKLVEVKRNQGLFVVSVTLLKAQASALRGMETAAYVTLPKTRRKALVSVSRPVLPTPVKPVPIQRKQPRYEAVVRPRPARQFRGHELEVVERRAFDYAMDAGPNKPRVKWAALSNRNRVFMRGYFKVMRNVYRHGNECREYYEKIDTLARREQGIACRDHNGQWNIRP